MAFELNFVADVTRIFRTRLVALGYQLPATVTDEGVRLRYFNVKHRLIPPRTRSVHKAANFTCPRSVQAGLAHLEAKFTRGDDLRPHLSRGLLDSEYSDALLNDWGIYHFHLGMDIDSDGFATRTGPLLFARIEANDAYFIDVRTHGAWSSQALLRAVHTNWSKTIERYRLLGVLGLSFPPGRGPPTDSEIAQMRKAGINVLQELAPGCVYAPAGGGYTTDGTALSVVQENDALVRKLRYTEAEVQTFETKLRNELRLAESTVLPDPVCVQLQRRASGDLVAVVGANIAEMTVGHLALI